MSAYDLAIVIPAWNERENLELLLPALREIVGALGLRAQIIVADGGSVDGTEQVAPRWGAEVVLQTERGYGGALLAGFAKADAPFVVTMDADLSHRPVFLEALWRHRHDAEILIASRYLAGGRADMPPFRRVLSVTLNRVYGHMLRLPVRDLSSGFRMYRRDALASLDLRSRDFDILQELLVRVGAEGWRIREIPFHYMARGSGRSHARLLRFGWAYLKTLVRMWQLRNSVEAADYDARAFDSPIWLQRYWQRTRHRIVLDYMAESRRVLDVGCGSSRIILDLPSATGLDIRLNKLRWLAQRRSRLVGGTCLGLPFRDASFDGLINSEVIEHVPGDPPRGVASAPPRRHPRPRHARLRALALVGARMDPRPALAGRLRPRAHHALHAPLARGASGLGGLRGPRLSLCGRVRDDLQGAQARPRRRVPRRPSSTVHHTAAIAPKVATTRIATVA